MPLLLLLLFCFAPALKATVSVKKPQRIASGTVGTDEILWELLEGERERIVAVSMFSEDPRYSLLGPLPTTLKGRVGNSVESLLNLRPDLAILASYNKRELAPQLQAAGIPVLIQNKFHSIEAIQSNILTIGKAVGAEVKAQSLVEKMQQKLAEWQAQRPHCRPPRAILYSAQGTFPGKDTSFTSALEAAGFQNLIANQGLKSWAPLSREVLLSLKPDFIVVSSSSEKEAKLSAQIRNDPVWGQMQAVREGRLIFIPEALLSTVSHHILELVERFHRSFQCSSTAR